MRRMLYFTETAKTQLHELSTQAAKKNLHKQVLKTLAMLEVDLRHPSLHTHEFRSIVGPAGEKVFEAYAQNKTPCAYRVFFVYGPDKLSRGERVPGLTIVAITPHP